MSDFQEANITFVDDKGTSLGELKLRAKLSSSIPWPQQGNVHDDLIRCTNVPKLSRPTAKFPIEYCTLNPLSGLSRIMLLEETHYDVNFKTASGKNVTQFLPELNKEIFSRNLFNERSTVFFEVWKYKAGADLPHRGYVLRKGKFIAREILQLFAYSTDIKNNTSLMSDYLDQLLNKRVFKVKGKNVRWLMCGEINFLKNEQHKNNKPLFRFKDVKELNKKFKTIFDNTDIFINPLHTAMGNQGKLHKRREFLSKNERIYCSTANFDIRDYKEKFPNSKYDLKHNLLQKKLQYCYYNRKKIKGEIVQHNKNYILRQYNIKL